MKNTKIFPERVRIFFVFSATEPIPEEELLDYLKGRDFEEITEIPRMIGTDSFGFKRSSIARKGSCEVLYNSEGGLLSVSGKNQRETLDRFKEIEEILNDEGFADQVQNYGIDSFHRVLTKGGKKPLENFFAFFGEDVMSKFNGIMGKEVAPFAIRFYPKDKMEVFEDLSGLSDWYDISIQPYINNPQYYSVQIHFTSPNISAVKTFINELESKIPYSAL